MACANLGTVRQHNNADILVLNCLKFVVGVLFKDISLCFNWLPLTPVLLLQHVRVFCLRTSFSLLTLKLSISLIVEMSLESFFF